MGLLSAAEVRRVEKKFADGIGSRDAVELFKNKGERFSEATLRKYVQLGLLPKSRRVGTRGRNKGSSGIYPVEIVGLINEIKRALAAGATLEEIRVTDVGLGGQVQALQRTVNELLARFDEAVAAREKGPQRTALKNAVEKHRKTLAREVRDLDKLAAKVNLTIAP